MNLKIVSDKLFELSNQYAKIVPEYTTSELAYLSKKAKFMMETSSQFPSQPLRDAAVQELLEQTQEYENYFKLLPEKQILDVQIRIYQQISRNLIAQNWGEANG